MDYRSAHLAPVTPILRRPEGFRLGGVRLKIRVKLDDRGLEAFEVQNHLPRDLMGPFDIPANSARRFIPNAASKPWLLATGAVELQ